MAHDITVLTTGGTIDKVYTRSGELEIGPAAVREILGMAHTVCRSRSNR